MTGRVMQPPCGFVHQDEPASDVCGWAQHWAAHGATVLSQAQLQAMRSVPQPLPSGTSAGMPPDNVPTRASERYVVFGILAYRDEVMSEILEEIRKGYESKYSKAFRERPKKCVFQGVGQ